MLVLANKLSVIRLMKIRIGSKTKFRNLAEAALWTSGLLAVAIADPNAPAFIETCLLKAAGFFFCPGCGLGHSVGYLARGEFLLSFQAHPFAPIIVMVLLHRIVTLIRYGRQSSTQLREQKLNYV